MNESTIDEEYYDGLRCIAILVLSNGNRALSAMNIAGPSNRMKDEHLTENLPKILSELVNVVELNVTYS